MPFAVSLTFSCFQAQSKLLDLWLLRHFFELFNWSKAALGIREIQLFIRSVQINAKVTIKIQIANITEISYESKYFSQWSYIYKFILTAFF